MLMCVIYGRQFAEIRSGDAATLPASKYTQHIIHVYSTKILYMYYMHVF